MFGAQVTTLIVIVGVFTLFILGILMPYFVYRIHRNLIELTGQTKRQNDYLSKILNVMGPEATISTGKIVKSKVDTRDISRMLAICSCGKNFSYPVKSSGKKLACPGCEAELTLA